MQGVWIKSFFGPFSFPTFVLNSAKWGPEKTPNLDALHPVCFRGSSLLLSQLTFTCSKPTIETLEKGMKYVQS